MAAHGATRDSVGKSPLYIILGNPKKLQMKGTEVPQ